MNTSKRVVAVVASLAIGFGGMVVTAPSADAATKIPGMTAAQTKKAAWKAYKTYFGEGGCRADFEYAYRGVQKSTKKLPPEIRDMKVKKGWVLMKLRPYRGHCG